MSDLIDRLRNYQDGNSDLMVAAADEIKRLRLAIQNAKEYLDADDTIFAYEILNEVAGD